jgi:hypothetical protein
MSMAKKPVHRLIHQRKRPDGGVEWACPRCGHYVVRHDYRQLVVLQGAPNAVHVPGVEFPPDVDGVQPLSDFDQDFLRIYAMAW